MCVLLFSWVCLLSVRSKFEITKEAEEPREKGPKELPGTIFSACIKCKLLSSGSQKEKQGTKTGSRAREEKWSVSRVRPLLASKKMADTVSDVANKLVNFKKEHKPLIMSAFQKRTAFLYCLCFFHMGKLRDNDKSPVRFFFTEYCTF